MERDTDFWKRAYAELWDASGSREAAIAGLIERETGRRVRLVGLGAGEDVFLSGDAQAHGHEKGDADLQVEGTALFIEVTGPLTDQVGEEQPLWFRPDKLNNAYCNRRVHDTWLLQNLPQTNLIRVVHMTDEVFAAGRSGELRRVHPVIRGNVETYTEFPSDHWSIQPLAALLEAVRQAPTVETPPADNRAALEFVQAD